MNRNENLPVRFMGHWATILIARLAVGFVFVYASYDKILEPEEFANSIKNYDMLPYSVLAPFAIVLPWVEFWTGLFLILGFRTRASALIMSGMLGMFIIALGQAVARGLDIECGCFSSEGGSKAGLERIFEDIGLLILVSLPLIWGAPRFALDRVFRRSCRD
jgi:uncharacterized membrane protein YphA (DoxX/SURF4 family)